MDIGNLQEQLVIKCNKKIYLQFEDKQIDVLDANGNLNVRVKNNINPGIPTSSSPDGFYYNDNTVYLKVDSQIINLGDGSSGSSLPTGSIIMYHGDSAPSGWNLYDQPTGFNGVIYIINDSEVTPSIGTVTLQWKLNGQIVSVPVNAVIGDVNTFPSLDIDKDGEFPVQISYSSTNESVAYIDSGSGNITLRNPGSAIIKAITQANSQHGSANAQYSLSVKENITLDWQGSVTSEGTLQVTKGSSFSTPSIRIDHTSMSQQEFRIRYITYRSTNTSVATVGKDSSGNLTITIINSGTTEIYAECAASDEHSADYAKFTLQVEEAEKTPVNISVSDFDISDTQSSYAPTINIEGASLNEVTLQVDSDPNNVVSSISGRTISLTGNAGTATISVIVPETDNHTGANDSFELTVTETEIQKETISVSSSNQTITNDQEYCTPIINITGNASLSEVVLTKSGDSSNIVSGISNGIISLTGNIGSATIQVSIPENSTHYSASTTFILTVEEAEVAFEPYTVGLISDIHYCVMRGQQSIVTWDNANDSNTNASSLYDKDLKYLLNGPFRNADFVASPGDLAEWDINDLVKFTSDFKSTAPNKKFYCCMGNHDHQIVYGTNNWTKYDSNHEEIGSPDGSRWQGVGNYDCPGSLSGQSNLSYYIQKGNDMYIFLSTNYGSQNSNHDGAQWAHPQNQLNANDSNVQQMITLCGVNSFTGNESNFNFQYYSPSDLIWLYDLIRNNQDKRKFIFIHHFFPNKAGGGNKFESGQSSVLMGITFHFLNWLNDQYPQKAIWFSGHSHISWRDTSLNGEIHWCNKDYDYIRPTASDNAAIALESNYRSNKYISNSESYNRNGSSIRKNGTAWTVHLPSMSRPSTIAYNGAEPVRNINDCEAAIMRVYENYVEIEKLAYTTSDGGNTYSTYDIADKTLTVNNDGTGHSSGEIVNIDYITFVITNPSSNSQTAYITNKFKFYSEGLTTTRPDGYANEIPLHFGAGPWTTNTIKLEPGQSKTLTVYDPLKDYSNSGTLVSTNNINDFVGSTIDGVRTYTYCCPDCGNHGLVTNLVKLSVDQSIFQKNITYNLSVQTIDYDVYTDYANYYNPDTPDTPDTPDDNPNHKDTPVYMDFKIKNVGDYTIKTMGKVKLMVTKTINGITYYGSIYVEPKNVNEKCASIEIAPGQTYTLSHNDSAFLTKTAIQNSSNWTIVDQPLSFLNGGTCDENNTVPYDINYPDNKKQLYVYTYLVYNENGNGNGYDENGYGYDNNSTILTELKSSNIFDAGDSNRIVTYEIDIETNEQKSYYCGS